MSKLSRFAVIGQPVAHSLSPQIHAAFARQAGLVIDYRRIAAPLDGFAAAVAAFFEAGGDGLNVTLPFKLEARALCGDRVAARAARAGAVNWLAREGDGPSGDNTDGVGLVRDLRRLVGAAMLTRARVLVVGAGGAARGVVPVLREASSGILTVAARDPTKARAMLTACGLEDAVRACGFDALDPAGYDLVVNATSASLSGERLPLPDEVFRAARLGYDMMYGAGAQRFLTEARRGGAEATADGLGMLVEQAAESFRLWHGFMPATAPVLTELRGGVQT